MNNEGLNPELTPDQEPPYEAVAQDTDGVYKPVTQIPLLPTIAPTGWILKILMILLSVGVGAKGMDLMGVVETPPMIGFKGHIYSLPIEATIGEPVTLRVETKGAHISWFLSDGLTEPIPQEYLQGNDRLKTVTTKTPGKYWVVASTARHSLPSNIVCQPIIFNLPGPTPGPGPGPNPPVPPNPPPIPTEGLHVLVVEKKSERGKLPKEQVEIFDSTIIRDYLNSKCAKGPDGKQPEYRFYDVNQDVSNESSFWQSAMKIPRAKTPWIIIGNGKDGISIDLPANRAKTLELLQKYGG